MNSAIKIQPDLFVCQNTLISVLRYGYNLTVESKTFLSLSEKSFTRCLKSFFAQCANQQSFRSWPESGSVQLHGSGAGRASPCTCKSTDWKLFPCSLLSLWQDSLLVSPSHESFWHWRGRHIASLICEAFSRKGSGNWACQKNSFGKCPLTSAPAVLGQHKQWLATCSRLAVMTSDCICHVYPRRFVTWSHDGVSLGNHLSTRGNPHSFPCINSSFIPRPLPLFLAQHIMLPWAAPGADSCIHNLSLVLQRPSEG